MEYNIDFKRWGRFFSVPCNVVDEYISLSDGDFIKVLLCVLCSNSQRVSTAKLAEKIGITEEKVEDAIIYWAGLEVIVAEKQGEKLPAMDIQKKQSISTVKSAPVQNVGAIIPSKNSIDAKTRVKYSTRELSEKIENNEELKALYDNIQTVLSHTINGTEIAAILNLYEYYNFSAASILMIAEYCVSIGKNRMAYIETVAKNWFDKGICSYSEIEQEIIRQGENRNFENKVMNIFGMTNKLTKKQKELISKWRDMGFSLDMLGIAYEKCMNNTTKLSFAYINKILENWSGKQIMTPQQVDEDDMKYVSKKVKPVVNQSNDTSYDLNDWEKYAMSLGTGSGSGN